jgi:hypothetical protein
MPARTCCARSWSNRRVQGVMMVKYKPKTYFCVACTEFPLDPNGAPSSSTEHGRTPDPSTPALACTDAVHLIAFDFFFSSFPSELRADWTLRMSYINCCCFSSALWRSRQCWLFLCALTFHDMLCSACTHHGQPSIPSTPSTLPHPSCDQFGKAIFCMFGMNRMIVTF